MRATPIEGEGAALSVAFSPAEITANLAELDARVASMVAGYAQARYDLSDGEALAQARRDRAYLNGIARELDERRKAVKREYVRPLEAFEAAVNQVRARALDAAANIKSQLDGAEAARREALRGRLEEHYEAYAGALAPLVPYGRLHDERWLNRSFGEVRAKLELEARVDAVARDWEALRAQEGAPHYDLAERAFFSTLDLGGALRAARDATAQDALIAGLREVADAAAAPAEVEVGDAPRDPSAPACSPEPVPPAPPGAPDPDARWPWVMVIESATRSQALEAGRAAARCGVTGRMLRGTLREAYFREEAAL